METEAGIELTPEEVQLIKSLKRLAAKWQKNTDRLWLFSGAGTLNVMMYGDIPTNPEPEHTEHGGVNPANVITYVMLPNDGGDW